VVGQGRACCRLASLLGIVILCIGIMGLVFYDYVTKEMYSLESRYVWVVAFFAS